MRVLFLEFLHRANIRKPVITTPVKLLHRTGPDDPIIFVRIPCKKWIMVLEIVQDKLLGIFQLRIVREVLHLLDTLFTNLLHTLIKTPTFLGKFQI